jgi:hypothetical protein
MLTDFVVMGRRREKTEHAERAEITEQTEKSINVIFPFVPSSLL